MMRTGAAADAAIAAAEDAADAAEINLNKGNTGPPPDKKPPDLSGGYIAIIIFFFEALRPCKLVGLSVFSRASRREAPHQCSHRFHFPYIQPFA